ncbi:Zn-ribbon domain-containing OB-fold protein [Nocardia vaccinii]|uniref:Zn-ribbon domain-containing OB-fold protein n=1 Tax=Nocardia vaccinii TaxID=1822 RepID=UPI000829A76E|nr:OB-fold domain-containing protein [Nocardia vaccinii]
MTTSSNSPATPTPDIETEPWWSALRGHRLMFHRCNSCARPSLYVRGFCPHCWSDDVALERAAGRGRLYAWTVVHQAPQPFSERLPYIPALVDLPEGLRLMTNIEDCPIGELRADLDVQVAFRNRDDGFAIPVFVPVA